MKIKAPNPPTTGGRLGGHPANHSGRGNKPIRRVVIHSAVMPCEVGRARQLAEWNRDGTTGGSWHYSTDPEHTFQCSWDSYVCWHAPPNSNSVGIEMADHPGPVPGDRRGSARWKALKRSWRWARKPQRKMLRRTARLTAHLCLAYGLPVRYVSARGLRAGRRGWTTHAAVSKAYGQSTHWDPGFWPRFYFANVAKRHAKRLRREAANK